jgi:hypothetical protein
MTSMSMTLGSAGVVPPGTFMASHGRDARALTPGWRPRRPHAIDGLARRRVQADEGVSTRLYCVRCGWLKQNGWTSRLARLALAWGLGPGPISA